MQGRRVKKAWLLAVALPMAGTTVEETPRQTHGRRNADISAVLSSFSRQGQNGLHPRLAFATAPLLIVTRRQSQKNADYPDLSTKSGSWEQVRVGRGQGL